MKITPGLLPENPDHAAAREAAGTTFAVFIGGRRQPLILNGATPEEEKEAMGKILAMATPGLLDHMEDIVRDEVSRNVMVNMFALIHRTLGEEAAEEMREALSQLRDATEAANDEDEEAPAGATNNQAAASPALAGPHLRVVMTATEGSPDLVFADVNNTDGKSFSCGRWVEEGRNHTLIIEPVDMGLRICGTIFFYERPTEAPLSTYEKRIAELGHPGTIHGKDVLVCWGDLTSRQARDELASVGIPFSEKPLYCDGWGE